MALSIGWRRKSTEHAVPDTPARPDTSDRNAPACTASGTSEHAGGDVLRASDRRGFQVLVERHQAAIYGYLRSRLMQHADAEDLTQEVFLRAYVGRARFDGSIKVRAWLVGIARNVLREYVRTTKRRKEVAWTALCLELEELGPCHVEQQQDEILNHLPRCVSALGPSARQALELHYESKLHLAEIGEKLHRSQGAVKLLMFRARQALKRCLDSKISGNGHDGRGTD